MEIFKLINWHESYQCSNLGNVKSFKRKNEKILKSQINHRWYLYVKLDWKHKSVHRLVALHFISNENNLPEVNHIDWNKSNNKLSNLEWCTKSYNMLHSFNVLWNKNNFQICHPNKWKIWIDNHRSKQVNQLDLNWLLLKTWWSINQAALNLWISPDNITTVCKLKRKSCWWFRWEYSFPNTN